MNIMNISRRQWAIMLIVLIAVGGSGGGFYLYLNHRPVNTVDITVNFDDCFVSDEYDGNGAPRKMLPVYNTLNIWDIDWFTNPSNNPTDYANKYYWVDQLVVMTATGGRDTYSNEYLNVTESGVPTYNFTKLETMIDWLQVADIDPVFVIGNTPHNLTDDPDNVDYGAFGANTASPNNFTMYRNYIRALAQHVLNYGGSDFLANWTWRIYTEPDNDDWLENSLDAYFQIYNTSACAIRSVLPDAKIALGNMMDKKMDDRFRSFLNRLDTEIPDVFPDQIGWSVYGFVTDDLFLRKAFSDIQDWKDYLHKLGYDNIEFVIEEGQILTDDDGKRLWSGDSTEIGAAFTANAFKECIVSNISRYTTWQFYSGELRTPKLNVIDMFMNMTGESLVSLNVGYDWLTLGSKRTIDGLASISDQGDCAHILLYNLIHDRDYRHNVSVTLSTSGKPESLVDIRAYVVDRTRSNFHVDWDVYSDGFTYYGTEQYNDGSRYDVALWNVLRGDERDDFSLWSWNHRNDYRLEETHDFSESEGQIMFNMDSNSVFLIEFLSDLSQ